MLKFGEAAEFSLKTSSVREDEEGTRMFSGKGGTGGGKSPNGEEELLGVGGPEL